MGLFDFFKRNKKKEGVEKIVQELQGKIFPGGNDEIQNHVNELKRLLNTSYPDNIIRGTLMYISTLFAVSQDKSAQRIVTQGAMRRPDNKFSEEDATTIYKYVVKRHLIKTFGSCDDMVFKTFYAALGNFEGGAKTDVIPGAYGEYGLCATNPVPVQGIAASEVYLSRLRLESGENIKWHRLGSTSAPNINNCIDIYVIQSESGVSVGKIYISPYQSKTSSLAPKGFIIH